ncbi:MAG TPA: hypothetical protein VF008_00810 [Niastella sp.]
MFRNTHKCVLKFSQLFTECIQVFFFIKLECILAPVFPGMSKIFTLNTKETLKKTKKSMAKETIAKENPVIDALRKLKEEEMEIVSKLKPLQEAIGALEKILDKSVKKSKTSSSSKEGSGDNSFAEESAPEVTEVAE